METTEYGSMYDQEQNFWWYRALHQITLSRLKNISASGNPIILDAGCGTGGLLKHISGLFPKAQLIGLEHNRTAIEYLKKLPSLPIVNGSVNTLPFADNSFEIIICNDVIYHQNVHPQSCLQEFIRILKPNGHLLINVAAYNWMYSAHDKHVHTRERYTAAKLKQQLTEAGFTVKQAAYWNSLLFPLMALHRLTFNKAKLNSDVKNVSPWQNKIFYKILHCEELLQRHKIFIPYGGSAWAWAIKP